MGYITITPYERAKKKKQWSMKVIVILIIIGALGTILKKLKKKLDEVEIGPRIETILTTALLKSAKIFRRFLETGENMLFLRFLWKTIG